MSDILECPVVSLSLVVQIGSWDRNAVTLEMSSDHCPMLFFLTLVKNFEKSKEPMRQYLLASNFCLWVIIRIAVHFYDGRHRG